MTVEERLAALEQKVESFAAEHSDFRRVHVSRRGVEGGRGETGPAGPVGPPADVNQVAEIAANLVQKAQIAKFQTLLNELEAEIGAVKAGLRWGIIEELKLSGVLDEQGNTHPSLRGERGADSTVAGPKGDKGDVGPIGQTGKDGVDGQDGRDGQDGQSVVGPQGPTGADSQVPGPQGERGEIGPEGLQGLPGAGLGKTEIIELVRDLKRRGTI